MDCIDWFVELQCTVTSSKLKPYKGKVSYRYSKTAHHVVNTQADPHGDTKNAKTKFFLLLSRNFSCATHGTQKQKTKKSGKVMGKHTTDGQNNQLYHYVVVVFFNRTTSKSRQNYK